MTDRKLEIGLNPADEIVVNFDVQDQALMWHGAVFTPKQARTLARKLLKWAALSTMKSRKSRGRRLPRG